MKNPKTTEASASLEADGCGRAPRLSEPDYRGGRWVYTQFTGRVGGLSVGVNLSPLGQCDYRCRYCRPIDFPGSEPMAVDLEALTKELEESLEAARSGRMFGFQADHRLPSEFRTLGQVMLSGEGEPTLCPNFLEVVETLIQIRARGRHAFFPIVLETNGSGIERVEVQEALGHLTSRDEVWMKLDAGTDDGFLAINRTDEPFERVLARIAGLASRRPVVLHSLFAEIDGRAPTRPEIHAYIRCLDHLRGLGAMIQRIQIHSMMWSPTGSGCARLPLASLSEIARQVRRQTGLQVDVF